MLNHLQNYDHHLYTNDKFRVFAISDIHVDYPENLSWLSNLDQNYSIMKEQDILILAGDVSNKMSRFLEIIKILSKKFLKIFFVPGNHDVWCGKGSNDSKLYDNSYNKLLSYFQFCQEYPLSMFPTLVGPGQSQGYDMGIWIVPLFSWYDSSWDKEPDIPNYKFPPPSESMTDYFQCRWPEGWLSDFFVNHHIDQLNDQILSSSSLNYSKIRQTNLPIISFSHFLPSQQISPEKRFLHYPLLAKCLGSNTLNQRVMELKPNIHFFGHSHFSWDSIYDKIRYISCPLGYPRERTDRGFTMCLTDNPSQIKELEERYLWLETKSRLHSYNDFSKNKNEKKQNFQHYHPQPYTSQPSLICLFDNSKGFASKHFACWSRYYEKNKREPDNTDLPYWVSDKWTNYKIY